MFGFLKNLISGIVSFITGLLPGKKNGGYYLQIDDEIATETTPAAPKPETTNGTKATVAAEPATTAAKEAPAKNGKVEPAPAPVTATTTTAPAETTFAPKYLAPSGSSSNGRRRPGANMSSYLDMASQVKTPG